MHRLLAIGLALLAPSQVNPAADDAGLPINNTVRIELEDGRSFTGRPISFRDDIVTLRTRIDDGEVERGFPAEAIARLHFPPSEMLATAIELVDDGRLLEALPHLEALWRQRAPFLTLLDPETVDLLTTLPSAHLEAGNTYRAIALAKTLLPHASTNDAANRIHETILLGHYELGFYEETEKLARDWIQEQPDFPTSALGWKVLGDLALRKEDFEGVIWIALQPITIAGTQTVDQLNGCYALAIHAFHQQEETNRAAVLYREMNELGLPWPEDDALQETGEFYRTLAATITAGSQAAEATGPDLDLRPPEENLNLPIRRVRKNLRTRDP